MDEGAVEGNLLPIRVGEENVMVSSPRADRYWKSGSRGGSPGMAGRPDGDWQ